MEYFSPGVYLVTGVLWILIATFVDTVTGLKCVQCSSVRNGLCESGQMEPTNCSDSEQFCIKTVGEVRLGKVIYRNCYNEDITDYCENMLIHSETARVCFSTCQTDGCNSATPRARTSWMILCCVACIVSIIAKFIYYEGLLNGAIVLKYDRDNVIH